MQLIIITPETDVPDEAAIVNRLLQMGLNKLHIRKPQYDASAYRQYINLIEPAYHKHLVIHGGYKLYNEGLAGGIHLRSAIRDDAHISLQITAIPHKAISTSFHSWEELTGHSQQYGHIFISPVFNSISKPGYEANVNLAGIAQARKVMAEQNKPCPDITALGGIDKSNILSLKTFGYDGAALLGAIWKAANPLTAFAAIKTAVK